MAIEIDRKPGMQKMYSHDDVHSVLSDDPRPSGFCPAAELGVLYFLLGSDDTDRPWIDTQLDKANARAIQIGDLPSYLVISKEQVLLAIPQDDGSLLVRPFDEERLFSTYQTLRSISGIPTLNPTPTLRNFIHSFELYLQARSVIPS